ncbi:hypothetical protein [uncultured Tenacibaculum sp.]|uniref:hypothetical protein n=1 Tax=uncultured Tenacibaculum sp. TaxID=174713 RepID=UPI00260561B8|nr:hypothetical protein [uncultured Tenacibaculum sp.]
MKFTYFLKGLVLAFFLLSCNANEDINQLEEVTANKADEKTLQSPDLQGRWFCNIQKKIKHRGIYINNFENDILGNFVEETKLLMWCNRNNFKEITLYTVSSILNSPAQKEKLTTFVIQAHLFYGIKVSFSAASKEAIIKIKNYQMELNSPLEKCDGIFTEYEFWNPNTSGVNYNYYKNDMLGVLENLAPSISQKFKNNLYVYNFSDASGQYTDNQVLEDIVDFIKRKRNKHRLVLVNYRANAQNFPTDINSNYYKRIQDLANIAAAKNVKIKVIVLYMTRNDVASSMYNYFADNGLGNDFEDAFISFKNGFKNSTIQNKRYLNLFGYQIYRYSDAKLAKPLGNGFNFDVSEEDEDDYYEDEYDDEYEEEEGDEDDEEEEDDEEDDDD